MKTVYSNSIMASYATFKELYKSQKYSSLYQILSEFIKYVIVVKSLRSFTSTDIQEHLNSEFGFIPPIAVIRTALRNVPGVSRDHQTYIITSLKEDETFRRYKRQGEDNSKNITDALVAYAEGKKTEGLDKNKLSQELIAFVLDEEGDPKYQQIIGSFVLANDTNASITSAISAIREGSILYSGLAFNISEYGSLSRLLELFLDTEILFDIVGLNGIVFKTLAEDFLKLVDVANKSGKMISLKFFSKVADDIDQFYWKAERIVSGHGEINFTPAMKAIVEGCEDISDISDKRVELYRTLRSEYAVRKDDKENYYTSSDESYNLEGLNLPNYPENAETNFEGYMFCSHINKLRKGLQTADYFSSKYLCITRTRRVLEISRAITESQRNQSTGEQYCDYAVSLSYITNLLWFKLNRGFGSVEFPKNLDVVIKARTILSSYITQGISATYKDIKDKMATGELTPEQAAARIVNLKEKTILPEDLDIHNIDESVDFSEKHFAEFEETLAQNRRLLKERDETIRQLSVNLEDVQNRLNSEVKENANKQQQIDALTDKVAEIEKIQKEQTQKKNARIAKIKLAWAVIWKLLFVCAVVFGIWWICKRLKADFGTWLSIAIGVVGIIGIAVGILKKDLKKYKDSISNHMD